MLSVHIGVIISVGDYMTGILILNKPEGFTSFDAVAKARRIMGEKKCGHSGTLDPMATGVMTVLFGGATRFCELLPDHNKEYIARLKLGIITDTLDITGKVLETRAVRTGKEDFIKTAKQFTGEITQLPPMYSAVSVNGQRLYDLARQGIEVERPERKVTVYSLDVLSCNEETNEYEISVSCSSGTYIRTLIADIGEKLGCGAVMTALKRTKANGFSLAEAVSMDELIRKGEEGCARDLIMPLEKALEAYPAVKVTQAQAKRFHNGGELSAERVNNLENKGIYRVYSPENIFLGLGENDGENLTVKRVYNEL